MTRWHAVVGVGLALSVTGGPVLGQPVQPKSPYAPDEPDDSVFERADIDAKADTEAAMSRAKRARELAQCLRVRSAAVDVAARRLRLARGDAALDRSKAALDAALVQLDTCWDAPFEQSRTPGRAAAPQPAPPSVHAHFGFGQILVEEGPIDSDTIARPLRDHAERYRRCYDQALKQTPSLQGTMHFRVRLERRENHSIPISVAIPASSLADDAVRRCVAQAVMTTAFPAYADASSFTFMMAFAAVSD
jgi:hypothetical protein